MMPAKNNYRANNKPLYYSSTPNLLKMRHGLKPNLATRGKKSHTSLFL